MIRVFIVASSVAEQDRLRVRIASPDIAIAGMSAAPGDLVAAQPDVAVVAGHDVLTAAARGRLPPTIVWTDVPDAVARVRAWGLASWGVVRRGASARQLQAAVLAVASGLCVIPGETSSSRPHEDPFDGDTGEDEEDLAALEPLTAREREVLDLASRGLSNREIAATLSISEHTVKFHLAAIYGKLGVSTRTAAVRRGLRRGILEI